jgi:F-type H+-transporting ATPase subunit delta
MDKVALHYAKALFDLALEEKAVLRYKTIVVSLLETYQTEPNIRLLFGSAFLSKAEKEHHVELLLNGFDSPTLVLFFKVLVKHHRTSDFPKIAKEFISLANDYLGIAEGLLYSYTEISKDEKQKIEASIGAKLHKQVELTPIIDERLLGGVKVVVNDHIFDGTLLNKIEKMKTDLLKGKVISHAD